MNSCKFYELTTPQKSIWKIEKFYGNTTINNIVGSLKIDKNVNFSALEKAFNLIVEENDAFRTNLTIMDNEPKQFFKDYSYIHVDILNISDDKSFSNFKTLFLDHSFSLINSDLYNIKFLRMYDGSGYLFLSTHHIISDGYSMSLFIDQIYNNYTTICENGSRDLSLKPSYVDFIHSNSEYPSTSKYEKAKTYWNEQFKSMPNSLSFKKHKTTDSINCDIIKHTITKKMMKDIQTYCKNNNISENVFFLSVFTLYLQKFFNKDHFILGNPSLNRANFKEKQTFGMFVSIMPFTVNVDQNLSFIDFCNYITQEQRKMYRHLSYPYQDILTFIKEKHNVTTPLYDFVFSFQNFPMPSYCKWYNTNTQLESLQVHMKNISNDKDSLTIHYHYQTSVFTSEDIHILNTRILHMIEQILSSSYTTIEDISILSPYEQNLILNTFNDTDFKYNKNSNIITEFEKIVKHSPNLIAVKDSNESLTYNELNNQANILAAKIKDLNISSDVIAFSKERSVSLIVTILGILKSGHTYMPIDPEYPIHRIEYMLQNSNTDLLITSNDIQKQLSSAITGINVLLFETLDFSTTCNNPEINIPSDKLCYIMYTSGSTGNPKAVSIKHYNVLNFVGSIQDRLDYSTPSTVISVTTICFDIFVFELFPTLLSGLTLFIASELEAKVPKLLSDIIVKHNVSKLLTTPSRIDLLFEDKNYFNSLSTIREFLLGGEPLTENFLQELKKHTNAEIVNLYGPTETTVYSSMKILTNTNTITIGNPIYNTKIYILDKNNSILPIGFIGEIAIAGDGVGNGYFNDATKTSEVFVNLPFSKGLVYKTGDLGFYKSNGELICLGRKDNQIKIRGYRIELDDINTTILKYANISKCITVDRLDSNGHKYLCAYIIASEKINTSSLNTFLLSYLPNYMIPQHFIQLADFPLTINHKIDKKALPDPMLIKSKAEKIYIKPTTKTQKILSNLLCESLNITKISIQKDIFDFNLDSLNIINIQTKLLEFDIKLNTQDFYVQRTIENISNLIDNKNSKSHFNYDNNTLSKINYTFHKHATEQIEYVKNDYSNILLAGCTGYLGIHILNDLLQSTNAKIYCLVRNKGSHNAQKRLSTLYKSYFNKDLNFNRINLISTDITAANLGLSQDIYSNLSNVIDLVINSAANVKYYGSYSSFKKINVDVVSNIINFCKLNQIKFVHISTLGVSGNFLINNTKNTNTFSEDDFFIGQKYRENVYIQTKFEAEELIYSEVRNGLNASIIRVGNLTSRHSDGHFQLNFDDNAFYNILLTILKYKILPDTMLSQVLEFTPVDMCASAITKLILNVDLTNFVFHLFNQNYIKITDLLDIFKSNNFDTNILSGKLYKEALLKLSIDNPNENILKGIVNDLDEELGLSFMSTVNQENIFTNNILKTLDFNWPKIDTQYILNILEYLKSNNYI